MVTFCVLCLWQAQFYILSFLSRVHSFFFSLPKFSLYTLYKLILITQWSKNIQHAVRKQQNADDIWSYAAFQPVEIY